MIKDHSFLDGRNLIERNFLNITTTNALPNIFVIEQVLHFQIFKILLKVNGIIRLIVKTFKRYLKILIVRSMS